MAIRRGLHVAPAARRRAVLHRQLVVTRATGAAEVLPDRPQRGARCDGWHFHENDPITLITFFEASALEGVVEAGKQYFGEYCLPRLFFAHKTTP